MTVSRRNFLKAASVLAGTALVPSVIAEAATLQSNASAQDEVKADYTIRIATSPVEIAPKKSSQPPPTTANSPDHCFASRKGTASPSTSTTRPTRPEQFHWHGRFVPTDADGAAEEGTVLIPPHGNRRISFMPTRQAFASITRTFVPEPISAQANTAA